MLWHVTSNTLSQPIRRRLASQYDELCQSRWLVTADQIQTSQREGTLKKARLEMQLH